MNNYFLLVGVVLSTIFIFIYLYIKLRNGGRGLSLGDAVALFLSGSGISAGIKVCYLGLYAAQNTVIGDERVYVILGGLSVIWVSIETVYKTIYSS